MSKATEKARIYALGKSSSEVFRKAHENDFIAGYNQAIDDSLAAETLRMLMDFESDLRHGYVIDKNRLNRIQALISKIKS